MRLLGLRWSRGRVLDEAARIEGHPDNVAACVHGSIVASATDARDVTHAARLELHPKFGIAVVVPGFSVAHGGGASRSSQDLFACRRDF